MDQFHSWIETAGVLVTAAATIALAWVTTVLARETKRLAAIGQQPQVVLTLEQTDFAMHLLESRVQNIGTAAAYDIRIEFEPPLEFKQSGHVPRTPINKLSVLTPGQGISRFLCSYDELITKRFTVMTSWKRIPTGTSRENLSYEFDLSSFDGLLRLGQPPAHEIAGSLKNIVKALEDVVSGFNRLKVDVFDARERAAEQKDLEKSLAEFNNRQDGLPEFEP